MPTCRYRGLRIAVPVAFIAAASIAAPAVATEKAVSPEKNPPGDIPDTQVFLDYHSPEGFSLKVPEGWARTDLLHGAKFVDTLDGVAVTVAAVKSAPTVPSAGPGST